MATHEHGTHSDSVREREVIVTDNGRGDSSPMGMVMAIIGILVILLVGWFAINAIGGSGDGEGVIPDDVNINVDQPDSGGEG